MSNPGRTSRARERIQKVLAAQGVGSRRQVEAWIVEGRISVNGQDATPGQAIGERDDVRLDGRRLRLTWSQAVQHQGLLYHRPPQEEVRATAESDRNVSLAKLPRVRGLRWIPISPLAASDGGLELFVTDGSLAAALGHHSGSLDQEYSVRVRGDFDESRIEQLRQAALDDPEAVGELKTLELTGGEGVNRWVRVVCTGLRPRDFKRIFEHCGLEANRILRTRVGPLSMDRSLARGRHRAMTESELQALAEVAGLAATGSRKRAR